MSIFDSDVAKALNDMEREKIRAAEFEKGLTLQLTNVEKSKSPWGAEEDAPIVERGILEEGEQFTYTFKDTEGLTRKLYSKSLPFCIAIDRAELNFGDWVKITRTGSGTSTKYVVEKIEAPVPQS